MNIRRASEADLDALLRLYEQLSPANAGADRMKAEAALGAILHREGVALLVAEIDSAVIGTVTLVTVPNLTHDSMPWAQIENMVVGESLRGTGAGRRLVEECLWLAREAGCYKVQLQSAEGRTGAHRFYERMGFVDSSAGFRRYLAEH
ncbi:MAG TPA: GNAT family N-acetyltransferase [Tepidiformaceae bacterium]|nr:GNAT family N-acetyltransferase [Tepidiformaceae bacterium]